MSMTSQPFYGSSNPFFVSVHDVSKLVFIFQPFLATVMGMEWKDYEDFWKKYGPSNPEMFGKWTSQFLTWETLGTLVRNRVVRAERLYDLGAYGAIQGWEKFKDIIQSRRDVAWGQDYMSNAEFFTQEMLRVKTKRDASFKDKLKTT